MGNFEKYMDFAGSLVADKNSGSNARFKNQKALADFVGIANSQAAKYRDENSLGNIKKFMNFLDKLGVNLNFSANEEPARDVCFVDAKIVSAGDHVEPPRVEDYIAAPLVGKVGAGPGYAPKDEVKSWFLVYKNVPSIMYRRNLLAVEIAQGSFSMVPTLHPGDIVLIDRDDCTVSTPGKMWLVKDDYDQGMIKRVKIDRVSRDDLAITYYSDNIRDYPPVTYSLRRHFDGDMSRAIVGRVIWAWSDVREK